LSETVHGLVPALVRLLERVDPEDIPHVERTIELLHSERPTQDGVIWTLTNKVTGRIKVIDVVNEIYRQKLSGQTRKNLSQHMYHRLAILGYRRVERGIYCHPSYVVEDT
jgi:hypothetical protein